MSRRLPRPRRAAGPQGVWGPLLGSLVREKFFMGGLIIILAVALMGLLAPYVAPSKNFLATVGPPNQPPSLKYPLGTTGFGQDVLSQLLFGTRNTLFVATVAALIATLIGLALGVIGGFLGGAVDAVFNFLTNTFLVIPTFTILLLIATIVKHPSLQLEAIIIGAFGWPWGARAYRSFALSMRSRDYVTVARLNGMSGLNIALTEVLPQMLPYIAIMLVMTLNGSLMADVGLDAIGLGPGNTITLGLMLNYAWGWGALVYNWWWWWLPPVIVIILIATSLTAVAMGMDRVFNPRLRGT
ncbi:MAG: ABC transporter permease [Acidilobus sp.]|nr:ABC transporter permease [Acidilobus sp.]MCG2896697.1 ABC transporter permease [Acidilobus sp.]